MENSQNISRNSNLPGTQAKWAGFLMLALSTSSSRTNLNLDFVERTKNQMSGFSSENPAGSKVFCSPHSRVLIQKNKHLMSRLEHIKCLPKGWDSYNAEAPSITSIDIAKEVLDALDRNNILGDRIIPTSDSSLLIVHKMADDLVTWEISLNGDIGVMVEFENGATEFRALARCDISEFAAQILGNV